MIIDDYIEYSKTYKAKYGDKCVILMQVGSFFELYSITDVIAENDIYAISDICNIQISKKNKSIPEVSINNPLMAGFPLYTIQKYTQILLNNNYTVVLIEQVTEPPNPERKVTEILSPGMNICISNKKSNYMMVLYYELINEYLVVGISGMDLSTGKTFIYEAGSTKQDPEYANDEAYRFISTYNPAELIILSSKMSADDKHYILKNLNINNILVHFKWDAYEFLDIMRKLIYQKGILEKAFFSKKSMLSIVEVLNLEKLNIARIAFCCLLQFAYEHNADIIQELYEPEIFENRKQLSLEFNSAMQLNILGLYQGDKPLLDILNRCSTAFGSRAFKEKLLMPIIDIKTLESSYDDIDQLLEGCLYKEIRKGLNNILDLERIKRKMILGKLSPAEWSTFNTSLLAAKEVFETLSDFDTSMDMSDMDLLMNAYTNVIDLDEASRYNLTDKINIGNFFVRGVYADIDEVKSNYNMSYENIKAICEKINNLGQNDNTLCKIEDNDRDGHYITMTKKRFENAASINKTMMMSFEKKAFNTTSSYKLINNDITAESANLGRYKTRIASLVLQHYYEFMNDFIHKYNKSIDKIIKFLTRVDIACCCARNAHDFCYIRPIINSEKSSSFIEAKGLRHPIIERIDESVPYIGNDISLGGNGLLLYGINASGKSSFMKAVGLNIIMAQAGMFVPAQYLEYHPYHHIFTRISGMDNIYKGMSSFTVEMTELRNILQRCSKHSLVIGDEICSGTEFVSALAIVASGIDTLVKKNSSFMFATHLHELTKLRIIKEHILSKNIDIKHMHIHVDEQNRIVYDRMLQDGQGSQIYGIEVCKSLDMPCDFMKHAEIIRKEVQGLDTMLVKKRKSRYNAKVLMDKCAVCGAIAIDTHHIKYQQNADNEGFIGSHHKNIKHNLVPLCKTCHTNEHNNTLKIDGYMQTSQGVVLQYRSL